MDEAGYIRGELDKCAIVGRVGDCPVDDIPDLDRRIDFLRCVMSAVAPGAPSSAIVRGGIIPVRALDDAAQVRSAHLILADDLDRYLVTRLDDVPHVVHEPGSEIGDMHQPFTSVL